MRAVKTLGVVLCSALGGLGCESKEPLVLPDGPVDDTSCVGFSAALTPTVGEGPLHRGTPIVATWRTGIVDAQVEVHADGAAVRGATYVHDGRAMFLAERLLPASTRIDWRFSACGTMHAGHFDTGALSAPVEFEDAVGRSFGFDLRQLEWEHPTANTTANGYVLRWHLAPTVVVDVLGATLSSVHVAIAPGVVTEKGDVVRDLSASHVEVHAGLLSNPYAHARVAALDLSALDGPVTLRDVELIAGFADGCFEDTRLVAVMDVRALEKLGKAPCARLQSLTGQTCVPCDDDDQEGGCFLLAANNVRSVSSTPSSLPVSPQPLP